MANIGGYNVPVIKQTINHNFTPKPRKHYGKLFRFLGSVCILCLIVLFTFNVFRVVNGSSSISFTGFLNWLSTVDIPQITINVTSSYISDNWGIFNGFRDFLNSIAMVSTSLAWLGANVINFVIYISYFVFFLFS